MELQYGSKQFVLEQIKDERKLKLWSQVLFKNYNFPLAFSDDWFDLHRSCSFTNDFGWNHFALYEEDNSKSNIIGAGSIFLGKEDSQSSFANLCVAPDYRGKGLGTYITAKLLLILSARNYRTVTLYAAKDALAIYTKLQFTQQWKNTFFVRT